MLTGEAPLLTLSFFVIAALYAAVGQAGASGYLATMSVFGMDPSIMKPTALALNTLVAAIATFQFRRAGHFDWRSFYPFGVLGFPFSLLGGAIHLPSSVYHPVVGSILLLSGIQLIRTALNRRNLDPLTIQPAPFWQALLTGAGIGIVSGTTGTGGGIFLAPILLSMKWGDVWRAAAITAAYNLLNSAAALLGAYSTIGKLPASLPWWLFAVGLGGAIGSTIGTRIVPATALRTILAIILLAAGFRMILI